MGSLAPVAIYWPSPTLRCMTVPAIGADDQGFRVHLAGGFERIDLGVALAEDAEPVARRGKRHLAGAEIVARAGKIALRLLPVLEGPGLGEIEIMLAPLVGLGEDKLRALLGDLRAGGDEVVLPLHELARFDRGERRARP